MNRELLELTVLVNSEDHQLRGLKSINKKGNKVVLSGPQILWKVNDQVLDSGIKITKEYQNKIRYQYENNLKNEKARAKHRIQYLRTIAAETDDEYYFRNREELLNKYGFAKTFLEQAGVQQEEEEDVVAVEQAVEQAVDAQVQQVEADIAAQVADAENEPIPGLTPFEELSDDLQELYINRGYEQAVRDQLNAYFRALDRNTILEFIRFARNSSRPVTLQKFIDRQNVDVQPLNEDVIGDVAGMFDQAQAEADIAAANAGVIPGVPGGGEGIVQQEEPVQLDQQPSNVEGTADNKVLYKERYHETSLELYFQNSSAPQWDPVLESGIMGLKISKEERIMMMDSVIKEFGAKIFVMERKSDTLEELNELVQLQFCILRNLHLGARARTATVRLSDLENLQRAANNAPNNAPIKNSLSTEPVPINQTRQEASFIKNYDRLQHLNNLKGSNYYPQSKHDGHIKSKNDPHTIGLLTGNNIESVKKDVIKRIVPKNKLVRTSKN